MSKLKIEPNYPDPNMRDWKIKPNYPDMSKWNNRETLTDALMKDLRYYLVCGLKIARETILGSCVIVGMFSILLFIMTRDPKDLKLLKISFLTYLCALML